jgi:hypothetical protein
VKITWSPEAIDGLNLDMERPNQFGIIMKLEQGYELPTPAPSVKVVSLWPTSNPAASAST